MNLSRSTAQPVAPRTQHQNQAIIPQAIAPNRLATVDLTGCGSSSPSSTLSAGSAMCLPSLRHSVGSKSLSVTTKQCPTSSVAASPTQQSRSNPSAAVMPSLSAKDMNSTSRTIPIHERSPKVATRSTRSASVVVPATGLSSSSSTPAAIAVVCRRSKSTAVGTTSGYDNTIAVTPRELRSKRSAPELSEAIQAPKRIKHS
ncbi:hypothetical protein BJ742DRAFT_48552 [Cladochytrium replicatum]|nr:hypothetical protein BJ742DRAFT_48552 [Cladochytrium replicatum]